MPGKAGSRGSLVERRQRAEIQELRLALADAAVEEAGRVLGLDDLRDDRGELELVDETTGEVIDMVPAPIAVVCDNGSCFRGKTDQSAFAGDEPLLRRVRTRVRSLQTNGVIERCFGTLKDEHRDRAPIDDGGALAMETARFRDSSSRIRPHQALDDQTPRQADLDP
jgi:putative transposase